MHEVHHTNKSPVLEQIVVPISRIEGGKENLPSMHQQDHQVQPSLIINDDDDDLMPKKMKLNHSTSSSCSMSHNKIRFYKGTSNNNINTNSCNKNNPKLDQHLPEIVKDKRSVRNFNYKTINNESFEDDELEKKVTKLRKLPSRQKCVNIDESTKIEKCQSRAIVDTNHMPQDISLLSYIKNMKSKLKSVYEPKRTMFYKKLVKTPEEIFYLKEGYSNITVDNGMVNLFNALKSFEKKHKYKIKFVKSKLGDALKRYSANRDICWDVVHLESNSNEDLLKYKLCYGAIPDIYIVELETIVCRILLSKLNGNSQKSKDNTNQLKKSFDIIEGELELIIFQYWKLSTNDILLYKEHRNRKKDKMVFCYMFKKLETNIIRHDFGVNKKQKDMLMDILKQYKSYATFEKPSILTAASLLFLKKNACKLIPFIGNQYDLWSVFFHKFNLHSMAFEFTIKALLEHRDSIFQYLFTRVLEIDQFNMSGSAKSLWYHGVAQKMTPAELEDTIISRTDVVNCLSYYFLKPTNVPRAMCVKLDNFYFLHIDLFVSFIINNRLYKYHRKLTAENCNHFFILNEPKYFSTFIGRFETKKMVTSMKIMMNNLLKSRLNGELVNNMKLDTELTFRFFNLVYLNLNYTLTPSMLREGPALTDMQWASIFISALKNAEMLYFNELRWSEKPYMLGGACDDIDYDPENEDLDPLKNVHSAELTCGDVTDDNDDGYAYSVKFGPSSDEETDFNSDESEAEGLDGIVNKILIEKKNERLLAECQYLNKGNEHKLFKRKLSKTIQDRVNKVGYFNKLTPKNKKKPFTKGTNVGHVQLNKPLVNNVKCVPNLKTELEMVAAGVLDMYELKNEETHIISPDGLKVFGLIPKNKIKTSRNSKGCTLCPTSKCASYNMLIEKNFAIPCCLTCIQVLDATMKNNTSYSFERLQKVLKSRTELRFKSPLLFDNNFQILSNMPPMLSHNDMYCSTFNKLDPKCGKILSRIAAFGHYSENMNQSFL